MYTPARNDLTTLLSLDAFWDSATPLATLVQGLQSDNWQVQQAALAAIGDRAETDALPAIEALLDTQDTLGIYTCPDEWHFDAATTDAERETWRCRYRVKQAALRALAQLAPLPASLLDRTCRYATDQAEDYPVRVAACELLAQLDSSAARTALQQAAQDGEWCTATTAKKALLAPEPACGHSWPQSPQPVSPFHLDIPALRRKLATLTGARATLWHRIQHLAHKHPNDNPWLLPFVALIDERPADIAAAKSAIADYLALAETRGSRGYLFNIWCFAFPHCRWAMWFDMLHAAGYYDDAEADAVAAKFLLIQFRDHHSGMLIKPYPECVDNQAAALVLSSYVVGSIFADRPGDGHLARKLRDESAPRLEAMIGGMPASGYSGEGSTYQGLIVAFAVPLLTEALEAARGEDLFDTPLAPNGASPRKILEMTRRLWMPGGLLLPWDHYGYQFGITYPLAYLAHRSGDPEALHLLEHVANYARMTITSAGWGYDQPIWTLVYWPQAKSSSSSSSSSDGARAHEDEWKPWAEPDIGGALVDPAGDTYLMQMWDETAPMCHRTHVNPNSLVLAYKGIPFTADGAKSPDCTALNYDGAIFERSFGAGASQTLNLSCGCAGSHNAILIDGHEALRPLQGEWHGKLAEFDPEAQSITGDVTSLYASVSPDCKRVLRRSRLIENRFWLVEDCAEFAEPHDITSRWWFRPDATAVPGGVDVRTPQGTLLQMRTVFGPSGAHITRIDGYPLEPDGCSDRVDFHIHGTTARWLYVLWPTDTLDVICEWPAAFADNVHRHVVDVADLAAPLLRIPRGIDPSSRLRLNGVAHDLSSAITSKLLPTVIDCTPYLDNSGTLTIEVSTTVATGQDEKGSGMSFPDQPFALCTRTPAPELLANYSYSAGGLKVESTTGRRFTVAHSRKPGCVF